MPKTSLTALTNYCYSNYICEH